MLLGDGIKLDPNMWSYKEKCEPPELCAESHLVWEYGQSFLRSCVYSAFHMVYPDGYGEEVVYHIDQFGHAWAVWRPARSVQVDSTALDAGSVGGGEMAKVRPGDTEFGGGDGIIQRSNIEDDVLTPHEEVMAIYATNPGDPLALDGSEQVDASRVGKTASYNPPSPKGWNAPHE